MSLRALRRGEWLVVVALVVLVGSFFVHWFDEGEGYVLRGYGASAASGSFEPDGGPTWTALGIPWSVLVVLAAIALLATVVLAARSGRGRPTYGAMVGVVVALPVTVVVLAATAVRVLLVPPTHGFGDGEEAVSATLAAGSWIALAALLVGIVGLWVALADDRTSAADSRVALPRARTPSS